MIEVSWRMSHEGELLRVHQPISNLWMILNCAGGRPLVRMSARCSWVEMYLATIPLSSPMLEQKK